MRIFCLLPLLGLALFAQTPSFIPDSFTAPRLVKMKSYQLVPLGPDLAKHDYDAYMSSIEHLQKTFSSGRWPNDKITMDDAKKDVEGEISRFNARRSFTYAVLSPDGSKELGCVYVSPSPKVGYDAMIRVWVTKAQYDAGFEKTLIPEVKAWLAKEWPFQKIAWPRRDIPAEEWAALPSKPRK